MYVPFLFKTFAIKNGLYKMLQVNSNFWFNHMVLWNLFDIVNSIILEFSTVLKFPTDDL